MSVNQLRRSPHGARFQGGLLLHTRIATRNVSVSVPEQRQLRQTTNPACQELLQYLPSSGLDSLPHRTNYQRTGDRPRPRWNKTTCACAVLLKSRVQFDANVHSVFQQIRTTCSLEPTTILTHGGSRPLRFHFTRNGDWSLCQNIRTTSISHVLLLKSRRV